MSCHCCLPSIYFPGTLALDHYCQLRTRSWMYRRRRRFCPVEAYTVAAHQTSVVVAAAAAEAAAAGTVSNRFLQRMLAQLTYLLIFLVLSVLIRLLVLLLLLSLLLGTRGEVHLRVHLLHFGQIAIHEIAQQHLRIERPPRVGQFDMRHAVDGPLFQNREPCPVVVDVGFQLPIRRFGRQSTIALFPGAALFLCFDFLAAENGGKQSFLLLFRLATAGRFPLAFFFALLLEFDAVTVQNQAFASLACPVNG